MTKAIHQIKYVNLICSNKNINLHGIFIKVIYSLNNTLKQYKKLHLLSPTYANVDT